MKFSTAVLVSRLHPKRRRGLIEREDADRPRLDRKHTATPNLNSLAPFGILMIKLSLRLARMRTENPLLQFSKSYPSNFALLHAHQGPQHASVLRDRFF